MGISETILINSELKMEELSINKQLHNLHQTNYISSTYRFDALVVELFNKKDVSAETVTKSTNTQLNNGQKENILQKLLIVFCILYHMATL